VKGGPALGKGLIHGFRPPTFQILAAEDGGKRTTVPEKARDHVFPIAAEIITGLLEKQAH